MAEIHQAVKSGAIDKVSQIIESHPESVSLPDDHGNTPLHLAVVYCNKDLVKLLLAKGASRDAIANLCGTPLEAAEMCLITARNSVSPQSDVIQDYQEIVNLLSAPALGAPQKEKRREQSDMDERTEFESFERGRIQSAQRAQQLYRMQRWDEAVQAYRELLAYQERMMDRWGERFEGLEEEYAGFLVDLASCLIKRNEDQLQAFLLMGWDAGLTEPVRLTLKALNALPNDQTALEIIRFCAACAVKSRRSPVVEVDPFPSFAQWKMNCEGAYVQLREHEDFARGAAMYQEALTYRQDIPFVYHALGVCLVQAGEVSRGIEALRKAYEMAPDYCFVEIPRAFIERHAST